MNVGEHAVLAELQQRTGGWLGALRHPAFRGVRRHVVRTFYPQVNVLRQQLQQEIEYHYKAVVQVGFTAMFVTSQPTMLSFPLERPVFLREYSANMYGTVAYFVSKLLVEVPLGAVQALEVAGRLLGDVANGLSSQRLQRLFLPSHRLHCTLPP